MNPLDSSTQARHARLEQLLSRAAELPAAERDIFLTAECGEDQALRQEIYAHLLAESKGLAKKKLSARPGPVTSAVNQALIGSEHDRRVELLGKVVGDYRLVAIVGVGGAGTVYLGERADRAYSAQVAIKVVANTQLSNEVQRRFAAERQILANLNHPYIGRLLDAGETFFDEPFLVMEYVHGEAVDRYCDNQRLSVDERIRLFLKVCDAVQYAHRNLIVHRDLKPGNILISKEGIPKLLDFGIAKLLDDSAMAVLQDGIVAHTRVHDRLLTPEYASPEQIRGQPVTTTSDVYALGVILYELLTGVRPYTINDRNQLELERSICIQDVIKPSQRIAEFAKQSLSTTSDTDTASTAESAQSTKTSLIATARNTSFKKLEHQLYGDLDAIIQRALRKEPDKRYSSVEHLMDDLNRHLNQEPVEARQGNRWYYTQRFVRRHTLGVIAGTTAILSLIAVAIILSIQAKRLTEQRDIAKQQSIIAEQQRDIAKQQRDKATQESARAESVSNFMQDVFTAADPYQSQDRQITAKDLLDRAAQRISNDLTQQPEVRARLLEAIGKAYGNQDQLDLSIKYLEDALHLQQQLPLKDNTKVAVILDNLGRAYLEKGSFTEATRVLNEARTLLEVNKTAHSAEYLQTLIDSGLLAHRLNQIALAKQFYESGLVLSRELHGNFHPETAGMLGQVAQIMTWQGNYSDAEKLTREATSIFHATLPDKHPERISADINLGELIFRQGRLSEAENYLVAGLADQRAVFGNNSSRLINTYDILGKLYTAQRRWDAAEEFSRTGLSIAITNFGKTSFDVGIAYSSVANVLLGRRKFSDAEAEARASLKILQTTASPDHQYTASAEYLLAASLVGQHRAKEAEPMLRENMERWTRAEAPAWRVARSESLLGSALLQLHKPDEAKQYLFHSDEILSAKDSGAFLDDAAIAHKRVEEFQHCATEHRLNNCEVSL